MSNTTQLLRFITAGSVDDGKSTLIGRLLHDSKSIFEDQLSAISKTSEKRGMTAVDLSLLTDGLQAEREQGKSAREAIRQAALLRFRPILMTTLAALFAALPLMLGWGEGAELRRPLGLAIFGGLIVSQVLTLFTTPVIYLAFDRMGQKFGRKGSV